MADLQSLICGGLPTNPRQVRRLKSGFERYQILLRRQLDAFLACKNWSGSSGYNGEKSEPHNLNVVEIADAKEANTVREERHGQKPHKPFLLRVALDNSSRFTYFVERSRENQNEANDRC